MKRGEEKHADRISAVLNGMGLSLDPPVQVVRPDPPQPQKRAGQKKMVAVKGGYFVLHYHNRATGRSENIQLITELELGKAKTWAYTREYKPPDDIDAMFNAPAVGNY